MKRDLLEWMIVLALLSVFLVGLYRVVIRGMDLASYVYHAYILDDQYNCYNERYDLSNKLCFYENGPHGYIIDKDTDKKILRNIFWVLGTERDDTLLCFAKDNYRGFLNRHTGEVVIPSKHYRKAWLFSEGLAAVMDEDSTMKFIDATGREVMNVMSKYTSQAKGHDFLFKKGHCAMIGPDSSWGLIDHKGNWTVTPQYDNIIYANNGFWIVEKDGMKGMLDNKMRLVADTIYRDAKLVIDGIEVLKKDYTRQLLSLDGEIINDFLYTNVEDLSYKTGCKDGDIGDYAWELSPYKAYHTTYNDDNLRKVGLLGPDGIPVTPPVYQSITAINANSFRGFLGDPSYDEGLSVLFNNKGQIISPSQ